MQQCHILIHFRIPIFFSYFYVSSLFLSLIIFKLQLKYTRRQIVKVNTDKKWNIQLEKNKVHDTGALEDDVATIGNDFLFKMRYGKDWIYFPLFWVVISLEQLCVQSILLSTCPFFPGCRDLDVCCVSFHPHLCSLVSSSVQGK